MRVIVAGSRNLKLSQQTINELIKTSPFAWGTSRVASGGAVGIDQMGENWARQNGLEVDFYYPEYDRYPPKVAPIMRNKVMADNADALIAIWDGKSRGTKNMIDEAKARNLKIHVIIIQIGVTP